MLKGTGNGGPVWGVKTGFFFAGTGAIVCVIGWFIIPEVARRTPAEINEMCVDLSLSREIRVPDG
jgi:hypothetical protein